jgi:hypothetical protein
MLTPEELSEAHDVLSRLLALVGAEVDASTTEAAYLAGATDALARMLDETETAAP